MHVIAAASDRGRGRPLNYHDANRAVPEGGQAAALVQIAALQTLAHSLEEPDPRAACGSSRPCATVVAVVVPAAGSAPQRDDVCAEITVCTWRHVDSATLQSHDPHENPDAKAESLPQVAEELALER